MNALPPSVRRPEADAKSTPAGSPHPASPPRSKRVRRWLLLGSSALVAAVVTTELALRTFWGFGHPLLLQKDADIGYLYQAHQHVERFGHRIRINAYHQRGQELSALPGPGVKRVLVLGDSVTFGTTLLDQSEIITELVARNLPTPHAEPLEVLNASAGSWSPRNELAYLERFGTFGAETVILQIGSHDLLQKKSTSERVGVDPNMPDRKPATALGEVWTRYVAPRLRGTPPPSGRPAPGEEPAQFAANMDALKAMIALVRRAGGHPIILHTPNRDEVVPNSPQAAVDYAAWRPPFLAVAQSAGVPVINLPASWNTDSNATRFFLDDVHLSAAGNLAVTRAVVDAISARWAQAPTAGANRDKLTMSPAPLDPGSP